jgi:hypothetical protein
MTPKNSILEFRIPSWALCALINGDFSGLSDEDQIKLGKFINTTVKKYGNANFMLSSEDQRNEGFYHSNDIDNLGGDCETLLLRTSKRDRTINHIIYEVNCKYGAPMGRNNKGQAPTNKRIFDCKVPMVSTGEYDKGGAYWGLGAELRVKYTKDLSYIEFYRKGDK